MTFYIQHGVFFFPILFPASCLQCPDKLSPSRADAQGTISQHQELEQKWNPLSRYFGKAMQNPPMFINTSVVPPSSTASHQPYPFPLGWHLQLGREISLHVGNEPPFPKARLQQCWNAHTETGMMSPAPWAALMTGVALSSHQKSTRDRATPAHNPQRQGPPYPAIRSSYRNPFFRHTQ